MEKLYPDIPEWDEGGVKHLCAVVVVHAILDYIELCEKGVLMIDSSGTGRYSRNEITRFFHSDWCDTILYCIGGHFTGKYIIELLKEKLKDKAAKIGIAAYTTDGEMVSTFSTFEECAKFAGLKSVSDICRCCNGSRNTAGGYIWKYI